MRQLLQPIAAFVYCNCQAPPAGTTKDWALPGRRRQAIEWLNTRVNSAHSLKLFYFISWWNHAWNQIILAAKIILFHFRRGSMLKWNTKIL